MTPTPAAVAAGPRAALHAEPGAADVEEVGRFTYAPLPDEMPDADGSAFVLGNMPASVLWSGAMSAWLREDDGQPIRITRDEVRAERRRRRLGRPARRARAARAERLRTELGAGERAGAAE